MKNSILIQTLRKSLLRQMLAPAILCLIAGSVLSTLPLKNYINPRELDSVSGFDTLYSQREPHVAISPQTLYYTGCDLVEKGRIQGSYYYTYENNVCRFYLLKHQKGLAARTVIEQPDLNGLLLPIHPDTYRELIERMAKSLTWSAEGLEEIAPPYVLSTIRYDFRRDFRLLLTISLCLLASLPALLLCLFYLLFPLRAPAFRPLRTRGPKLPQILEAEAEMAHSCLYRARGLCLTPGYLICPDSPGITVIPVDSILWVYDYVQIRRIPWLPVKLTYILYAVTADGRTCRFVQKQKEDMDQVISILQERFPHILIGYQKENKEKAKLKFKKPPA